MKNSIFKVAISASMIFCMVSCDNVEDLISTNIPMPLSTGSCADAEYLAESRAWDVVSTNPEFENVGRIELTASGNYMFLPKEINSLDLDNINDDDYFITPKRMEDKSSSKNESNPFRKTKREDSYSDYGYYSFPVGTFKKISENEYELSDFGNLIVNNDGSLTLEKGGSKSNFSATPIEAYKLDELTRRFSRTWELVEVERAYYDSDGKLVKKRNLSQEEIESDYVKVVVVTQFGSYIQYDWDSTLGETGLWEWKNTKEQIFRYACTEDGYTDSGNQQVFFYNDYAMFLGYGDELYGDNQYYDIVDVLKTKSSNKLDI